MCKRVAWVCGSFAVSGWVAGVTLVTAGPGLRQWLLLTLAVAITATCVLGVVLVAWTSQGVYRHGYDIGWKDGRRAERLIGGAKGAVVPLRRRMDV